MSEKGRDYILFLDDILNAIGKIERYTKGLTFEELGKNEMAADAILRNFEIIGEAAKNVPENIPSLKSNIVKVLRAEQPDAQ